MDLGSIIYTRLSEAVAVTALVSTRIYPDEAPDEADAPLVVFGVTINESNEDGTAPITSATITASCYANTDSTAQTLSDAVAAVLRDWSGVGDVRMLHLTINQVQQVRSFEYNLWGRLQTYSAVVLG